MTGGAGTFFTSDGDFGYYGTAGAGLGLIAEIGAGATWFYYWPDARQSGEDCFKGFNWFVSLDAGEGMTGSVTISWPATSHDKLMSDRPCGVALGVGVGGGLPFNFLVGNSNTWVKLSPPASAPA